MANLKAACEKNKQTPIGKYFEVKRLHKTFLWKDIYFSKLTVCTNLFRFEYEPHDKYTYSICATLCTPQRLKWLIQVKQEIKKHTWTKLAPKVFQLSLEYDSNSDFCFFFKGTKCWTVFLHFTLHWRGWCEFEWARTQYRTQFHTDCK